MERQISLGMRVDAEDGEVGTVEKIVFDPEGREPGYLVIQQGRIRSRDVVVPVSLVSDVSQEKVTVALTREALDDFPEYEVTVQKGRHPRPIPLGRPYSFGTYTPDSRTHFTAIPQRSVPEDNIAIEKGMDVVDAVGDKVGQIQGLVATPESRQVTHLVLRQPGPPRSKDRLLPVDLVEDVRSNAVRLRISSDLVAGLQPYIPPEEEEA